MPALIGLKFGQRLPTSFKWSCTNFRSIHKPFAPAVSDLESSAKVFFGQKSGPS